MTDLDTLLGNNAEPAPTFLPFSQWSADKEAEDPVKLKVDYSDYIRESYIQQGKKIDLNTEEEIREGLYTSLVDDNKLVEGDMESFNKLLAPPEIPFEDKFNLVKTSLTYDDPDQETLNQYTAWDKALKSMAAEDITPESAEKLAQLRTDAELVVQTRYNDVKRQAVRNNELPFAVIYDEKGNRKILASDRATETDLATALKQSKAGGLSLADAYLAQEQLEIPEGFKAPRFKLERYVEAANVISELAKNNQSVSELIDGRSTNLAVQEYSTNDIAAKTLDSVGEALVLGTKKVMGLFSEETRKSTDEEYNKARATRRWSRTDEDEVAANLSRMLVDSKAIPNADAYSMEEIKAAVTELALQDANRKGKFELHTDDKEVGKNIRNYGFGAPVIHPAALANEDLFNKTLAARPDISEGTKEMLQTSRVAHLTETFNDTAEILSRSNVADGWNEALIAGRQQGKQNYEILNDFLKDENNYNELAERSKGVGRSVWDAGVNLLAALPAALGAKWAQDTLVNSAQANADRRAVANLFGVEMGFGQDLAEAIAPLVTDVAATAVLAMATAPAAGAGGAAYMAAKQGARLTAKGLIKSVTSSAFKVGAKETTEQAAQRLVTTGLIKQSSKDLTGKGALEAIKGYNSLVAQRIGSSAASFIPAATRSGAATYGSVFLALSQNKELNLTREQIHDRALGAAMSAGAITGIITSAFGAFGKAGVEDAMLRGMTFKQAKSLLGAMANTKNLSDDVFKAAVKDQLTASLKKFQQGAVKGVLKGMKDEAEEEGLDQLLNGFVEDAALNQNTPMLERLKTSMYAAAMGGVLGGAVPVLGQVGKKILPNAQATLSDAARLQQDFYAGVSKRLEDSGSPITAKLVQQILSTRVRSRTAPTVATGQPPITGAEPTAPTPPTAPVAPVAPTSGQLEFPFAEGLSGRPAGATPAATTPTPPTTSTPTAEQLEFTFTEGEQPSATGEQPAPTPAEPQQLEFAFEEGQPAPVAATLTPEAQAEVDTRQQELAALTQPVVGERKGKGGRKTKTQKRVEQLQAEIEHIQQTGTTEIPADVVKKKRASKKAAAAAVTQPTPAVEDTPQPVDTPDIVDPNELTTRIAALPQEEADQLIRDAVSEVEADAPTNTAFISADTINSNFEPEPVQVTMTVAESVKQAAVAAGIDPAESALDQAQHIALFEPDQNTDVTPKKTRQTKAPKQPAATTKTKVVKPAKVVKQKVNQPIPDYTVEYDPAPFQQGEQLTDGERGEMLSVVRLANRGYPVRFGAALRYGVVSKTNLVGKSDFLAKAVYATYPLLTPDIPAVTEQTSSRKRTYFDPAQNKVVTGTIKMPLDVDGRGVFNNDPVLVAEMLSHNIPVYVPTGVASVNPAFVIKNGYVTDVRMATADGTGVTSAVTLLTDTSDFNPDNSLFYSYSNLPFYPDGVEGKLLPVGARNVSPLTGADRVTSKQITFGELQSGVAGLLANRNALDAMMSKFGTAKLEYDFYENAIQSAATEFLLLGHLFEFRGMLLREGSGFTVPSPKGLQINPAKKNAVIKQLSSRLKGNPDLASMAKDFAPLIQSPNAKRPTHTETVLQFIEDFALNNKQFDGDVMPSFETVLKKTRSRYLEQQKSRGVYERNKAMSSLSDPSVEVEAESAFNFQQSLSDFAATLGGFDPNEPLEEVEMYDAVKSVVNDAIDAIDADPALRDALNDLAFSSVYPATDAHTIRHVQNMSSKDLMARLGDWMTLANNSNRPDVLEFVKALREGGFEAGINLRNALKLTAIGSRIEGNPAEDAANVKEVQRQLSDSLGKPVSEARAKNFIKAMDQSVRRRLSRAVTDDLSKRASRDQNADDINRLGLVSGDPESVIAALTKIAKSSDNPSHKLVAELLLEDTAFIRKVGFSFGASQANIAGEYVRLNDGTHSVFLNTERGNGLGLENVLLEEYVHAFLSDTLTKSPEQLTPQQRDARKRLEGLYQLAQANYQQQKAQQGEDAFNATLESGLENMDEFVANFLLNPEFQKHIKMLQPPTGQRGFFQRIIESLVSMFRKISGKENKAYTQALKDIVDLSKTTIRSTAVPFKQQIASNVTVAASKLAQATSIPRILATSVTTTTAVETTESPADDNAGQAQEAINQNLDAVAAQAATQLPTERVSDEFVGLMEFLKSRIPYGVSVTIDEKLDGAAAADSDGNIIINPAIMMDVMSKLDPLAQRAVLESVINEELGHVASFNSLTQTEIDELVDSFTDEDFVDIANAYYANNPARIPEVMANLQSDNPSVVARQKEILVEEKLRMRMQEVTRGYTTEDDNAFWSSKPSLLAILKRYIGGVLNRFVNTRKMRGSSNALDAAAFSLIQEMEAMSVGFVRTAVVQPLDTDAPAVAIDTYNRILNRDIFADIEEEQEVQEEVRRLATSLMSINTFQTLLTRGGLKVINGNVLVDDDSPLGTKKQIKKTNQRIDVQSTALRGWAKPSVDMGADNLSVITMPVTLKNLKSVIDAANFRRYHQPNDATVLNQDGLYNLPMLLVTYNEDTQQFSVDPPLNVEQYLMHLTEISALIDIVDALSENGTDENTTIPLQVAIVLDGLSVSGMMEAETTLTGGITEDEPPVLVSESASPDGEQTLPFEPMMQMITPDSEAFIDSLNERLANQKETFEDDQIEKVQYKGIDLDELVKSIESLTNNTFVFKVQRVKGRNRKYIYYQLTVHTPNAENIYNSDNEVSYINFEIQENNELHVGYLGRSQGKSALVGASTSFAEDMIRRLILDNDNINVSRITTTGGGNGEYMLNHKMGQLFFNEYPATDDPVLAQVKSLITLLPPQSSTAMNGYASWPTYGFQMDEMTQRAFNQKFNNKKSLAAVKSDRQRKVAAYITKISNKVADSLEMNPTQRAAHEINTEAFKERAMKMVESQLNELVEHCTRPDGIVDLNYGLHVNPLKAARSRTKGLWRDFGEQIDVFFDLANGSPMLKGYSSRILKFVVQKNSISVETLDDISARYGQEVSKATSEEEVQEIKDKYNEEAMAAGMQDRVFTSVGAGSMRSSSLSSVDFSPVVQLLEMPLFEYGAHKAPKGWLNMFRGDLSKPMKRLIEQRDEFKRAAAQLVVSYKEKMDKLVIQAYGDKASADWDLIAKAQGYIDGNILNKDTVEAIDAALTKELAAIAADPNLDRAQKKAERAAARQRRDDALTLAEDTAIRAIEVERDAALQKLGQKSSDLAAHIVSMRNNLIKPIQQKMIAAGLDPDIGIKVDKTGGIYVTRSYAMFNDPTYAERVRTDPQYAAVRDAAMKFFTKQLYDTTEKQALSNNMSAADAAKLANDAVLKANQAAPAGSSYGAQAMEAFLSRYDGRSSVTPQNTNGLRVLENNLKNRKDLEKELRDLLGEYGAETGTDLIVRTFSTVAMVAAQQTFLNNLAKTGIQQGFFVDATTYAADPLKYPDYVQVRNGGSSKNDPLKHMYAPKEMIEVLSGVLNGAFTQQHSNTAEQTVTAMAALTRNLTGKAMAAKTLGSVGFYLRNMLGNMLFFAPAQGMGFLGSARVGVKTVTYSIGKFKDPNKIDAYMTELTGLGVIGDELQASMIRELLNGKVDTNSLYARIDKFTQEMPVIGKTRKGMEWLQQKATTLSGAIDAAYKIEYFEFELDHLRRAKIAEPNSSIGRLSDYDLKRMAADKVKMTAQSMSQAPPLATALSNSTFGVLFAPFIRFKMEVPRIVINTFKLGWQERGSDNAMIRRRGYTRMTSMFIMLGALSSAVPAALSYFLSDIGDEEDEALRKSMPEYLRGHTFWVHRAKDGSLLSLDLTYLNPFSLMIDPISRSLPKLLKGDVGGVVGELARGLIFGTYFDDQILAGNLSDVMENKDATTSQPIWIEGVDDAPAAAAKALGYIFEKTYTPRILADTFDALNAAGGDYTGFANSPIGQLMDGMYPVKVHEIDVEKQYRRFLFEHVDKINAVNKRKYELYSKEAIDQGDIERVYDDEMQGRRKLNQELLRVARGFEGLGLTAPAQFQNMKASGIGKDKARLLFYGVMDRPDINKQFAEGLIKRGYPDRLQKLYETRNRYNRYIFIEDPK